MNLTKILSVVFFVIAIGLGYLLWKGVNDVVEEEKKELLCWKLRLLKSWKCFAKLNWPTKPQTANMQALGIH